MNDQTAARVHWSFWLIGVLALLWHVGGCLNYLMQTNPEIVMKLPLSHRAIIEGRPAWATGGFAIGVFVGAFACLLLLLRKSSALYGFILALIGILVTMIHTLRIISSTDIFQPAEIFFMVALPIIVTAMLIWYSTQARKKMWFTS